MNFGKFLRTPFLQNISGRLLLEVEHTTKENQVKGEKQLTSSVDRIMKKYREVRKMKNELIKCFQKRVSILENKNSETEQQIN